jgi:hypothetical protein
MKRFVLVIALCASIAVAAASSAVAAPDNRNTSTLEVQCEEPIGDHTVTVNGRNSSPVAFLPDGSVAVAKQITGTPVLVLEFTSGGAAAFAGEGFTQSLGAHGKGHEGRLITCDFEQVPEVIFQGVLTPELAAELEAGFGLDPGTVGFYAGLDMTISVQFGGTALVMMPGQP